MSLTDFDKQKAFAMMRGYHARWIREDFQVLGVEKEFSVPLINPSTGAASRTFQLVGKLDAIVRHQGRLLVVEHKTSSEDVTPGGTYWKRLRLDAQVSTYLAASEALGYGKPEGVLYDVLGRPKLRPLQVTKTRAVAETPEEYGERCLADIAEKPGEYYVRGEVVRLADEAEDAAHDLWATAVALREAERANRFPRHVEACFTFNRACDYWDVCTGGTGIDNDERFHTEDRAHVELDGVHHLRMISTSEAKSFRSCPRKHHYSYRLRRRRNDDGDALQLGTMVHLGLEAWWKTANLDAALAAMNGDHDGR